MAHGDAALGYGYTLRLTVNVSSQNVALNTTTYSYSLVIIKPSGTSGRWHGGTIGWSVRTPNSNVINSGSLSGYDFRNYSTLTLVSSSITISGSAARQWTGHYDDTGSGGDLGSGVATISSLSPPVIPLAPSSLTVTRVSDTQQTLNWTRGNTYSGVVIHRSTDDGAFTEIARPSGNLDTYTDNATEANHKYVYRVAGLASAGQSAFSNTATVYTSPGAPASVTAERVTQTLIRVDATGLPPYATFFDIMDGSTVIATDVSLPWDHNNPNPATIHTYKVRGSIGSLKGSWSAPSNPVQLQAPPNAPTNLAPNGALRVVNTAVPLSWLHNPVDSSLQTSFQIRHRVAGASTWTTEAEVIESNSSYSAPASMFGSTVPGDFEWQVRTKGADPNFSPWSATATFTAINVPSVAINEPNPIHHASQLTTEWSYTQAQARPQSAWEVQLLRDGIVIENRSGSGADSSFTFTTRLVDGGSYSVRVRAATGNVWSEWAVQPFSVEFLLPAPPALEGAWNESTGSVNLSISDSATGAPAGNLVNLFTNPNLVGDGTYATVAENLFTNPRLVGDGTWAEVRRNYSRNPSMEGSTTGWATTPNEATITPTAEGIQVDVPAGTGTPLLFQSSYATSAAGERWSSAMTITVPAGFPAITLELRTYSYGQNAAIGASGAVTVQPGTSQRLVAQSYSDVSSATTGVRSILYPGVTAPAGARFVASHSVLEKSSTVGPYFDGSTTPATAQGVDQPEDFRWRWLGAENASESVMEIENVAGIANTVSAIAGVSTRDGKPALRLISTYEGLDFTVQSRAVISIPTPVRTDFTAVSTKHQDEVIPPPTNTSPYLANIAVISPPTGGGGTNTPGVQPLRIRHSGSSNSAVAVEHGGKRGTPDLWFTDFGLFAGNYTGNAFSGDDDPAVTGFAQPEDFQIRWSGAVDNSTSVLEIEQVAGLMVLDAIAGVSTRAGKPAVRLISTGSGLGLAYTFIPITAPSATGVGTVSLDAPLQGTLNDPALTLSVGNTEAAAPNLAGDHPLRVMGVETPASVASIAIINGAAPGNGDVWWTDLGLFAGDYDGPAFAGDDGQIVIDGFTYNTSWDGAPDNSHSIASPAPSPAYITLERSLDGETWEFISELPSDQSNLSDFESRSCGVTHYRATAYTDEGASTETVIEVEADSLAIWVGGAVQFSNTARLPYEPKVQTTRGRQRTVEQYEGRSLGVAYASRMLVRSVTASGLIFDEDVTAATRDKLEEIAEELHPVHCFRDFYGNRIYGTLGVIAFNGLGRRPSCAPDCASGYWSFNLSLGATERG